MPDLEWRLIYVASPGNEELDQELDDCLVGPVPVGVNAFEFEGSAPNPSKIPPEDVMGVAALILTGSYKDQEFVRVGYYQNTEYDNEEMKEALPEPIRFDRLVRDINLKPRVTRFQIKWCVVFALRVVCAPRIYRIAATDRAGTSPHHKRGELSLLGPQTRPRFRLRMTSGTTKRLRSMALPSLHDQLDSFHLSLVCDHTMILLSVFVAHLFVYTVVLGTDITFLALVTRSLLLLLKHLFCGRHCTPVHRPRLWVLD